MGDRSAVMHMHMRDVMVVNGNGPGRVGDGRQKETWDGVDGDALDFRVKVCGFGLTSAKMEYA